MHTVFFWCEDPTDPSSPFTPPAPGTARKGSTQGSQLLPGACHFPEVSGFLVNVSSYLDASVHVLLTLFLSFPAFPLFPPSHSTSSSSFFIF